MTSYVYTVKVTSDKVNAVAYIKDFDDMCYLIKTLHDIDDSTKIEYNIKLEAKEMS